MVRRVQVRYYAQLRDALGRASEEVELDLPAAEADVLGRLASLHPKQKDLFLASRMAAGDGYSARLSPADAETGIDIISPISGG
jgi:molybdopterin converting factor small subunit